MLLTGYTWFAKFFSHSVRCLFTFWMLSFEAQVLNFDAFQFIYFLLLLLVLWSYILVPFWKLFFPSFLFMFRKNTSDFFFFFNFWLSFPALKYLEEKKLMFAKHLLCARLLLSIQTPWVKSPEPPQPSLSDWGAHTLSHFTVLNVSSSFWQWYHFSRGKWGICCWCWTSLLCPCSLFPSLLRG